MTGTAIDPAKQCGAMTKNPQTGTWFVCTMQPNTCRVNHQTRTRSARRTPLILAIWPVTAPPCEHPKLRREEGVVKCDTCRRGGLAGHFA